MNKIKVPNHLINYLNGINEEEAFSKEYESNENLLKNIDLMLSANAKRMLVQGDVQSGKTRNLIEYIIKISHQEPHFIIFLTGLKNNLLVQNAGRFHEKFSSLNSDLGYEKFIVSAKEQLSDLSIVMINKFLNEDNITYITSELKRPAQLEALFNIVKNINGKVLIIDDEGDEATLAKNTGEKINSLVELENVNYICITATPYKNLYLNEKFYSSYVRLAPGDGYNGIKEFKNNYIVIKDEEKEDLVKTIIEPLIYWAYKIIENDIKDSQILFNFSLYKNQHNDTKRKIVNFIKNQIDTLTSRTIVNQDTDKKIIKFLKEFPIDHIVISNSDQDPETSEYINTLIDKNHYILIGGGNLSRGVTYKNLLVEVMINAPEIPEPGVLLQRARWFGYDKNLEDIRIFTTKDVEESLREIDDLNDWTKQHELGTNYKEKFDEKKYRRIKIYGN